MDKKVTTERDQSTEQLFSLRERNGEQLETVEEQLNRAGGNEEELFLQTVFLDKSANSNQASVNDTHTDSREHGIAWERDIPGADASDSAQQAALDHPGRSHSPAAEFQAGIGLNEHALEKTTPGIGALDASRGHALRVDDTTGAGSDYLTVSAAQQGSTTTDNSVTFTSTDLLPGISEADGDKLQVTGVSVDADHGTITANADGSWTFTPAADHQGDDLPLSVTVSDGTTSTLSDTSLNISQVNDRPTECGVNMGDTAADSPTPSGTDSNTDPQSNASDIDGDEPADPDESGASGTNPDTGSTGGSNLQPPTHVNTGPSAGAVDLGSTAEDTSTTFSSSDLLANASDIDGDDLQVTAVAVDPDYGSVTDNQDGSWTFHPAADYNGEDVPLSFTVSDGTDSTQGSASLDVIAQSVEGIELDGTSGSDTLVGTAGDDTFKVVGNAGLDQVDGGAGNDTIQGSRYNDTFQVSDNLDNIQNIENIDGGDGYDILQGGSGNDTLDLSDAPALSNIEEIDGGYGDDSITGSAGNDNIEGNRGNDSLAGGDGDDTFKVVGNAGLDQVDGGAGNDTIQGSRYNDTFQVSDNLDNIQNIENIDGGDGYDILQGGSGNDTLDLSDAPALSNIEEIDGGYGDDSITGSAGNDNIEGNRGNDTLAGGGGDDALDGGYGTDTLRVQGFRQEYQISQNEDSGYTITDAVENRDGTDTIENFELVQFQDQTSSVEDLLNPVEPDPAAAAEISGEELLYAMDAGTGPETGQGWAESVQVEEADTGLPQESAWDSVVDAGQEEVDLAATAMDLTPDTTGVIAMTEGANNGLEGLEATDV